MLLLFQRVKTRCYNMSRGHAPGLVKKNIDFFKTITFYPPTSRKGLTWIPAKVCKACRRTNRKPDPPLSAGYAIIGEWLISEWLIEMKLLVRRLIIKNISSR